MKVSPKITLLGDECVMQFPAKNQTFGQSAQSQTLQITIQRSPNFWPVWVLSIKTLTNFTMNNFYSCRNWVGKFTRMVPCTSFNQNVNWSHCPNVGQASTNRDHRLHPGVVFLVLWQICIFQSFKIKIVNYRPLTKVSQPLFLGLQMTYLKSFYSRIADMLEVVRWGAGYTTAIQNLGKSDYQLMQPWTQTFLTKLDSKHV